MRVATLIVLCLKCFSCLAQEPASKASIPDEAAQKAALAVIVDVYKPDYEKARTPAQKVELAKKLIEEGTATKDDLVGRFVLFRIARDIAAQQGDLATVFDAIGRIGLEFEADQLQMKLDAATLAVKAPKLAKEHQECAAILAPLIDEAIATDRYELAKSFVDLTLVSAREGKDFDRIKQMVAKSKEIEEIASEFQNVEAAKSVLVTKPTDPDANFAVGRFLCFVKGEWRRGVTMLALGSNDDFKAAALLELESKPDSIKLGDAWWKIAESHEGTAKSRTQAHAADWYRIALPGLSGFSKARVEQILAQLPEKRTIGVQPDDLQSSEARLKLAHQNASSAADFCKIAEDSFALSNEALKSQNRTAAIRLLLLAGAAASSTKDDALIKKATANITKFVVISNTFNVAANRNWQSTVDARKSDIVIVNAVGTWHTWPDGGDNWKSTADGTKFDAGKTFPLPGAKQGALLGRIGSNTFVVGRSAIIEAENHGRLELINNDDVRRADNRGELSVEIKLLR